MVVGAERRINHLKHLNDQTSSVRVRHGCTLKLFKHVNYDWLLGSLTHDVSALPAYNDQVSSLTCTCSQQRLEFSGYWGDWGPKQFCQNGGYAIGFATKVEGRQGDGDDTAMNGLKLQCSGRDFITSAVQTWGSWNYAWNSCRSGYTGAKVAVERPQGVIYTLFTYIYISLVIFIFERRNCNFFVKMALLHNVHYIWLSQ